MANHKTIQALAIRDAAQRASKIGIPCVLPASKVGILDGANRALQAEAARIFAESEDKRMNGGASGHIVLTNGRISGYVKDAATLVQFAGGAVAVTTHE